MDGRQMQLIGRHAPHGCAHRHGGEGIARRRIRRQRNETALPELVHARPRSVEFPLLYRAPRRCKPR
jgi:hypothetical protein